MYLFIFHGIKKKIKAGCLALPKIIDIQDVLNIYIWNQLKTSMYWFTVNHAPHAALMVLKSRVFLLLTCTAALMVQYNQNSQVWVCTGNTHKCTEKIPILDTHAHMIAFAYTPDKLLGGLLCLWSSFCIQSSLKILKM